MTKVLQRKTTEEQKAEKQLKRFRLYYRKLLCASMGFDLDSDDEFKDVQELLKDDLQIDSAATLIQLQSAIKKSEQILEDMRHSKEGGGRNGR